LDAVAEIRHLYFKATPKTIENDLDRAVALLKTIESAEQRQRAAVYMDGLAQMRSEWRTRRRTRS